MEHYVQLNFNGNSAKSGLGLVPLKYNQPYGRVDTFIAYNLNSHESRDASRLEADSTIEGRL